MLMSLCILIRKFLDEFKEEDEYMQMVDGIEQNYWPHRMALELGVKLKKFQAILLDGV